MRTRLGRGHPLRAPLPRALRDRARHAERREMVLLRLRDEDGLVGLGEAVPLSLRGGALVAQVVEELEGLARGSVLASAVEMGNVGEAARLPPSLELSAPARCAALTALLDLGERRSGRAPRRATRSPATRPWSRASRPRSPPTPLRWARGRVHDLQAEARRRRGRRRRCGPCARRSGPRRRSGSTPTRPGTWRPRKRSSPRSSRSGSSSPSSRWRRWSGRPSWPRRPRSRSPATRASRRREDALRAARTGAFRLTGIKLSKVGGLGPGARDRRGTCPPTSPARSTARSGSPPAAQVAPTSCARCPGRRAASVAHGLATQRLFASTDRLGRVRAARRHAPPARRPRPRRRDRRGRARRPTASSLMRRFGHTGVHKAPR